MHAAHVAVACRRRLHGLGLPLAQRLGLLQLAHACLLLLVVLLLLLRCGSGCSPLLLLLYLLLQRVCLRQVAGHELLLVLLGQLQGGVLGARGWRRGRHWAARRCRCCCWCCCSCIRLIV